MGPAAHTRRQLEGLVVFRALLDDPVVAALGRMLAVCAAGGELAGLISVTAGTPVIQEESL